MFAISDNVFIKPAEKADTKIIFESTIKQHDLKLNKETIKELLSLVDGHTQYLLFALISIKESNQNIKAGQLFEFLKNDERILLQSEELWESLNPGEQDILLKIVEKKKITDEEIKNADYLINSGFFDPKNLKIFSKIFDFFVKSKALELREKKSSDFSKKENDLLNFLESNKNQICEREQIIEAVWPETENLGVTDWAIDRLVARVRNKLKDNDKNYEIITIKTRGYKLVDR